LKDSKELRGTHCGGCPQQLSCSIDAVYWNVGAVLVGTCTEELSLSSPPGTDLRGYEPAIEGISNSIGGGSGIEELSKVGPEDTARVEVEADQGIELMLGHGDLQGRAYSFFIALEICVKYLDSGAQGIA
jgi:hypothetical protein